MAQKSKPLAELLLIGIKTVNEAKIFPSNFSAKEALEYS